MNTRQAVVTSLAMLGDAFNREVTAMTAEAYMLALGDLSEAEILRATKAALASSKFFPTPAELRTLVGRGLATQMAEAWEAVRSALDTHDYTASVDFGPLINAVVRNIGGWRALCDASFPELIWRRKDFERVYDALASKPAESLRGDPLIGLHRERPARIAVGGKLPAPRIESAANDATKLVRGLVNAVPK